MYNMERYFEPAAERVCYFVRGEVYFGAVL